MIDLAWKLSDLPKPTGPIVLSCFCGGGGSSMGYKLAGCDVLGGVEIDAKMMGLYRANLKPAIAFLADIRKAPTPTQRIDILDGSPPCTPFSMTGQREKTWRKKKSFREGATKQTLDDLFFAFIDYAAKIRPKVVVAENVLGLLAGNARAYVRRIKAAFEAVGYTVQLFRLNAAHFGVPQARERVFFVANTAKRTLRITSSNESRTVTTVGEALADVRPLGVSISARNLQQWARTPMGRKRRWANNKHGRFGTAKLNPRGLAPTLCANSTFDHWEQPIQLTGRALARLQSFPDDYNFMNQQPQYVLGMSVPPFMTRGIAQQIIAQVF